MTLSHREVGVEAAARYLLELDEGDEAHYLQGVAEGVVHYPLEVVVEEAVEAYLQVGGVVPVVVVALSLLEGDAAHGGAAAYLLESVLLYHLDDTVHSPHGAEVVTRGRLEGAEGVIAESHYLLLEVDVEEVVEAIRSLHSGGVAEITIFHFHHHVIVADMGVVAVLISQMTEGARAGVVVETAKTRICWSISNKYSPSSQKCTI